MKMKKSWLNGKNVILTGASSGIGKEITKILINEFDCLVLGIARNEEKMLNLIEELGEKKEKFSYKLFDVSSKTNWEDFAKFLEKENISVDVLINCAGVLPNFDKFINYDLKTIENIINVNFYSAVYSTKALFSNLEKSEKPMILNVSSAGALCAIPGTSIYSASKSALKSFTEALDAETNKNMRVSVVCPGFTKTDLFRDQKHKGDKGIIHKISMPADKMARKIIRVIKKRCRRAVLGLDAKLINLLYKFFPRSAGRICGKVLKSAKVQLFSDVFKNEESRK